jgi:hypothetical protein
MPPLDATSFENGYPTTEELVCSAISEERICNSCAMFISHTISLSWMVPCPDGLNADLIKVYGNKLTHRICKVIDKVWRT